MTSPAEEPSSELTDSEKLDTIYQQVGWLTAQLNILLQTMNRNPAMRMMMGRNKT